MTSPLRRTLQGLSLALLPTTLVAAPAHALSSAQPDGGSAVVQAARCISEHLPRGAQVFAAGDGSMRVVSFRPRASAARWTVRQTGDGIQVTQNGGPAGSARNLKGVCY